MEIQYIRKLTSSHMVVEQCAKLREWEEHMISHAAAEHLLFAECVREDGRTNLWYDITGKQSLDVILETKELQYELLCGLLLEVCRVVDTVEGILLAPDGILLLPECIFRDYRTQELFFCYYPGNAQPLPEAFGQLLEYLLTRLDHGDERAVNLAYGIYEQFARGKEGLGALKELLCIPYEKEHASEAPDGREAEMRQEEETVYEEALPETGEPDDLPGRRGRKRLSDRGAADILPDRRRAEETAGTGIANGLSGKKGSGGLFARRLSERRPAEGTQERKRRALSIPSLVPVLEKYGILSGNRAPAEHEHILRPRRQKHAERESEETFVFEPEEEPEQAQVRPTVLLGTMAARPEGILRYEGRGSCEDLTITGDSFVIGSEPECEGYLPSTTVSRKHARITKKDGIYFIEDLNSSNGTSVGGELLNYRTKMSLQKNEVVVFADEKFRFI